MTSGVTSVHRRHPVAVVLLLALGIPVHSQTVSFADGLVFNDFYAVTVDAGERFTLFDAASFEGEVPPWPGRENGWGELPASGPGEQMKYFFWIRRLGATGAITYPLSFARIASIDFTGPFGAAFGDPPETVPNFTAARLTLTDGTEQNVWVKTDGFLGGIDETIETYAMLWLRHDGIKGLEFEHNGTFARCPECGAIYFDDRADVCRFDGAELIPQRQR